MKLYIRELVGQFESFYACTIASQLVTRCNEIVCKNSIDSDKANINRDEKNLKKKKCYLSAHWITAAHTPSQLWMEKSEWFVRFQYLFKIVNQLPNETNWNMFNVHNKSSRYSRQKNETFKISHPNGVMLFENVWFDVM